MKLTALLFMPVLALLCGCASVPKQADFLAPDFNKQGVDVIACLPTLDLRPDRSRKLDLDAWVLPRLSRLLESLGYVPVLRADRTLIASLQSLPSKEMLEPALPSFNPKLPQRWILICCLIDSYSKLTLGSTGNAEMSAYLIDTQTGNILWKQNATGQIGQGGLLGMAMKGLMEESAIETAVPNLMKTLPPRVRTSVGAQ